MRAALVLIALGLAAACVGPTPHPTLAHAARAGIPLERLEHGRGLFVARCGNCHGAPAPGSRTAAEWAQIVPDMLEHAHLDEAEGREVLGFLKALAREEPGTGTATAGAAR